MVQFFSLEDEEPRAASSRRHELTIEVLKFLTPALGLLLFLLSVSTKYPWLSKSWVWDGLAALGVVVLIWVTKPRLSIWRQKLVQRKRENQFIAANDARLHEFVQQFAEFISDNNAKSLIYLLQNLPHMTMLGGIVTSDYIGRWFYSYREQLEFPTGQLYQFLTRCREFGNLVQQFNSHYVLSVEKALALSSPDFSPVVSGGRFLAKLNGYFARASKFRV